LHTHEDQIDVFLRHSLARDVLASRERIAAGPRPSEEPA